MTAFKGGVGISTPPFMRPFLLLLVAVTEVNTEADADAFTGALADVLAGDAR